MAPPAAPPAPPGQALYDNYGNLIVDDPWVKVSDDLGDREWNAVEPYQLPYQVDFTDDYPRGSPGQGEMPPGTMPPPGFMPAPSGPMMGMAPPMHPGMMAPPMGPAAPAFPSF